MKTKAIQRKQRTKMTRRRRYKGGEEPEKATFIFSSKQLSTQSNTDDDYEEVGIIHITDSAAINALREVGTGVMNMFGSKGFDNVVFDTCRNAALQKLMEQVAPNQKVCNLRMTVDNVDPKLIFVHIYGTLLQKKSGEVEESSVIEESADDETPVVEEDEVNESVVTPEEEGDANESVVTPEEEVAEDVEKNTSFEDNVIPVNEEVDKALPSEPIESVDNKTDKKPGFFDSFFQSK
jgi:hypothetical protein